jgi:predicted N-acetyltransferase YhbS
MPQRYAVRTAVPADAPQVGAVLEASYATLMRPDYDEAVLAAALPVMTAANPVLLASGNYFVAVDRDERIVGCGGWSRERPGTGATEPGLAHLRHFATHPDWARCGIGRAIYARCARDARRAGARRLECYASLNAERFYAALGFAAVHKIDIPMRPGLLVPSVVMRRRL